MDADGQHDVCNIPVIYDRLRQKDEDGRYPDIVLGSRFMNGSADFSISIAKKIAFHLFRFMIEVAAGRKIADPTTGLQGLSRKAVLYYSKYNHFDDKYPDTNMIMQMILLKFKVVGSSSHASKNSWCQYAFRFKTNLVYASNVFLCASSCLSLQGLKG